MKISDILNLDAKDILELGKNDSKLLRRYTSQLRSAAQKRIIRVKSKDIIPPAVSGINRTGGFKKIAKLSDAQVKSEFQRLRNFLQDPQSTVKGAVEFARQTAVNLGISDLSFKQLSKFLDVWSRIKDRYGDIMGKAINYDKILDFIHDDVKKDNLSVDEMLDRASERITGIYEEQESGGGVSDFFTIGGSE